MANSISEKDFEELEKSAETKTYDSSWTCIYDSKPNVIYRRPVPGQSFNQFQSRGLFDVPMNVLAKVLGDVEYRQKWDEYAIEIKKLAKEGDSDLIYWSCKFPWPLTNRDYLFWRCEKQTEDTISIIMRGTEHAEGPVKKDFVRVQHYTQEVRLKKISDAQTEFFINTSFDLMGSIPKTIQNWAVSKGVPQFLSTTKATCDKYMKENKM